MVLSRTVPRSGNVSSDSMKVITTVHTVAGGAYARFDSDIGIELVEFGFRLGMEMMR